MITENKRKIYKENLDTFILLCIPVAILAKIVEHLLLPEKYFYDSDRINNMVLNPEWKYGWFTGSYKVASDLFRKINIFNFTTLLQWSIFLCIVMMIIIIIMFIRCEGINLSQAIFGLMCVGLLNIYIFNISKDVIQFGIFFIIYLVVSMKNMPIWLKVILATIVLYWESLVYRSYYIIISFFFIVIYCVFAMMRKKIEKFTFKNYAFIIIGLFILVFVFLAAAQIIFPEDYMEIMEARNYSNQQGQTSAIKEVFEHNGKLEIFMVDYVINCVRMLFPIELLKNGVFYVPFIAFQVFMVFYLVRGLKEIKNLSETTLIALCVFLAYFMGSVLFEPDFGSFVRHEAATFPIIILMVFNSDILSKR